MNYDPNSSGGNRHCPRCGKELPANATFCNACGLNLQEEPFTAPAYPVMQEDTRPLRTSDYFVMLLVSAIPLIGLILMLVWAFSSTTNVNRRNFCRAQLIMKLIGVVCSILLIVFYAALFTAVVGEISSSYYGQILSGIFF